MIGSMIDSDDELLERYVAGDPEAFVDLYRRHREAIIRFFMRRTGDAELTADLTAEVFAAALTAARRSGPASGRRSPGCTGSPPTSSPTAAAAAAWSTRRAGAWRWSRSPSTTRISPRSRRSRAASTTTRRCRARCDRFRPTSARRCSHGGGRALLRGDRGRHVLLGAARPQARQPRAQRPAFPDEGVTMSRFLDDLESQLRAAARSEIRAGNGAPGAVIRRRQAAAPGCGAASAPPRWRPPASPPSRSRSLRWR